MSEEALVLPGVYRGLVLDAADPDGRGRVLVQVPSLSGLDELGWAMPCVPVGQALLVPAVSTPVWIMFENGDPSAPVWLGTWIGA